MNYTPEIWKPIPGFSHYQASTHGRVMNKHGNVLKPYSNWSKKNYLKLKLKRDDGTVVQEYLHRLIALTHIPNPHDYNEVNHRSNLADNNHVANLEWVSTKQNAEFKLVSRFFSFDTTLPPIEERFFSFA